MENYDKYNINNSFAHKANAAKTEENVEKKKLQKVVSSEVTVKKKTGFQKFKESFITQDLPKLKNFVTQDVIVPAVKKAITDIVKNGIDIFMYGEVDRRTNSNIPGSKVSYNRAYYSNSQPAYNNNQQRSTGFDYDQLGFATKADAEMVLSSMIEQIESYGIVTVADLFDAAGKSTNNHCANNYGWTDLSDASTQRTRDGYVLNLPKPSPINR